MRRADLDVSFESVDPAEIRAEIVVHHRRQPYLGDFFIGHHQLTVDVVRVVIDGAKAGSAVSHQGCLAYFRLDDDYRHLGRQALESYLADRDVPRAYVASWDLHHVDLIGGFATTVEPQAYQFELLDESALREPIDGLSMRLAMRDDLAYLTAEDFLDDYDEPLDKGQVRIAERRGMRVGIGMYVEHPIASGSSTSACTRILRYARGSRLVDPGPAGTRSTRQRPTRGRRVLVAQLGFAIGCRARRAVGPHLRGSSSGCASTWMRPPPNSTRRSR